MPTTITLPNKFVEDENGSKFAPITTPNAVRFSDGTNLNDHLGDGMKSEKLTIKINLPEGTSASVVNDARIAIVEPQSNTILYNDVWSGTDIELELGTTYPLIVAFNPGSNNRYVPIIPEYFFNVGSYVPDSDVSSDSDVSNAPLFSIIQSKFMVNIMKTMDFYATYFLPLFNNERIIEINYADLETTIATIYIDDTINSPEKKITRSSTDITIIEAIKKRFHRYLGYYDNGILKMCQLWDKDSTYFNDADYDNQGSYTGTSISAKNTLAFQVLSQCDFFVNCERPIYTRYSIDTSLGHNRHKIEISFANGGSGWKEWHFGFGQDRDVIGVFKLSTMPSVEEPSSITDYIPHSSPMPNILYDTNYTDIVALFQNSPFRMVSWDEHNIIAVLFYAIYGTTNSVNSLGIVSTWQRADSSSPYVPVRNGQSVTSGMIDGPILSKNGGVTATNFLGLENWIGNIGEIIGNARCNVSQLDGIITVTDRTGTRTIGFPDPTYSISHTDEQDGHTYAYSGTDYNSYIFPKMQFGQHLDVVATTDAIDYNYSGNGILAESYYDGEAYNDQQKNPSKVTMTETIDGEPQQPPYDQSLAINSIIVRTGAPTNTRYYFNEYLETSFEGVSSFCVYPSSIPSGLSSDAWKKVGTRMCFTGTTQLIEDPEDFVNLLPPIQIPEGSTPKPINVG